MDFTFLFVFVDLQENRLARLVNENIHPAWLSGAEQGVKQISPDRVWEEAGSRFLPSTVSGILVVSPDKKEGARTQRTLVLTQVEG